MGVSFVDHGANCGEGLEILGIGELGNEVFSFDG